MEKYYLREKNERTVEPIIYEVTMFKTHDAIRPYTKDVDINLTRFMSTGLTETKRGWTFRTPWLTTKMIKVFLPREDFEKIETL